MNFRRKPACLAAVIWLVLLALLAGLSGCNSGSPDTTETRASTSSSESVTPTNSTTSSTTTLPATLSDYDRELARTATVQRDLADYLSEQQVPETDPRIAIVYGLRARTQALTCRKALDDEDLSLADSAMKQVYSTMNLGRNVATGPTAEVLAQAYETIQTLGAPSDGPDRAAGLLDTFIIQLAPLMDEARAIVPTGSTTAS